jgi:hypothetical protein
MPKDPRETHPSSIVARAIDASTFTELQAFVADLESRPVERLLRDVAELVKPSDSKAQIVGYVIATKHRYGPAEEKATILESLGKTIASLPAGEVRDRVEAIVERIRTQER